MPKVPAEPRVPNSMGADIKGMSSAHGPGGSPQSIGAGIKVLLDGCPVPMVPAEPRVPNSTEADIKVLSSAKGPGGTPCRRPGQTCYHRGWQK